MRGRWKHALGGAMLLGTALATIGLMSGTKLYESQAILRVFPQESNILYATGDGSVLKTFGSFVKAETTYVASHPVMSRATDTITAENPEMKGTLTTSNLSGSIEIRRSDSLIVLQDQKQGSGVLRARNWMLLCPRTSR